MINIYLSLGSQLCFLQMISVFWLHRGGNLQLTAGQFAAECEVIGRITLPSLKLWFLDGKKKSGVPTPEGMLLWIWAAEISFLHRVSGNSKTQGEQLSHSGGSSEYSRAANLSCRREPSEVGASSMMCSGVSYQGEDPRSGWLWNALLLPGGGVRGWSGHLCVHCCPSDLDKQENRLI